MARLLNWLFNSRNGTEESVMNRYVDYEFYNHNDEDDIESMNRDDQQFNRYRKKSKKLIQNSIDGLILEETIHEKIVNSQKKKTDIVDDNANSDKILSSNFQKPRWTRKQLKQQRREKLKSEQNVSPIAKRTRFSAFQRRPFKNQLKEFDKTFEDHSSSTITDPHINRFKSKLKTFQNRSMDQNDDDKETQISTFDSNYSKMESNLLNGDHNQNLIEDSVDDEKDEEKESKYCRKVENGIVITESSSPSTNYNSHETNAKSKSLKQNDEFEFPYLTRRCLRSRVRNVKESNRKSKIKISKLKYSTESHQPQLNIDGDKIQTKNESTSSSNYRLKQERYRPWKLENAYCPTCRSSFISNDAYCEHLKQFKCLQCTYTTCYKSNLSMHKRVHKSVQPFQCEYCTATFKRKGDLTVHHRIHTGERPYVCTYCLKRFLSNSAAHHHIKYNHLIN